MNEAARATVAAGKAATAQDLAAELADYAARAERALAAEQARSHDLEIQLAAAKKETVDVLGTLEITRRELHLHKRISVNLDRLSKRRPVRFVMWLRGRRPRTAS